MNKKFSLISLSVLVLSGSSFIAIGAAIPPPPQQHTSVTISNLTGTNVTWKFQETDGTATSAPDNGAINSNGTGYATAVINFNSSGEYIFNINGTQLSIGIGYGPCGGSETEGSYLITKQSDGVGACTINLALSKLK